MGKRYVTFRIGQSTMRMPLFVTILGLLTIPISIIGFIASARDKRKGEKYG